MADKKTELSIRISTVDAATAKLKAINDRLDKMTKPTRDFGKALGDLSEKSGLNDVVAGFKGVGSALEGVLTKLAVIGGVAGLAVHALFGVVKEFDDLGDAAERVGLTADQLAALRYAAEKTGAPVGALDEGFKHFSENLGMVHARTGRLYKFLGTISPALQKQVAGAKDNATAFNLMAAAMAKLSRPADRAALAQKAFGDSSLAPLLAKGAEGVKELTDRYHVLAPGMQDAADKAGAVDDSLHDLKASTDGVKAAILSGLAPALKVIVDRLTQWFTAHQGDVAKWAEDIGKKLPDAVHEVVIWLEKAYDKVSAFVDAIGGLKGVAIAAGLVIAGPLLASLASLSVSLIMVASRISSVGGALTDATAKSSGFGNALMGALGPAAVAVGIASTLNDLTGGSIKGGPLGMAQRYIDSQKPGDGSKEAIGGALRASLPGVFAPDVSGRAGQALGGGDAFRTAMDAIARTKTESKLRVEFANAPKGMRVNVDPGSGDVDFSTGYQMGGT